MGSNGIISTNVFNRGLVIFLTIMFFHLPTLAKAQEITVMTRNLYIGAEIQSLAAAPDLPAFIAGVQNALVQITANNFSERATAVAAEIVEKNPHLVGLQEVYNFTIDGINTGSPPFIDYLVELQNALEAQGAFYYVAAVVKNLNLTIPIPGVGAISVTDHDVILARDDVDTEPVNLAGLCRSSMDGCNYSLVASAETPAGSIAFERGFVAVDAWVESFPVRFFNTHLEVRNPDPRNPLSPLVQRFQAIELMAFLSLPKLHTGPVIVVGDINSSPEDSDIIFGLEPPYMQLAAMNYDAWTLRPGKPKGFTCCQEEDLLNPESVLFERIDMIFLSESPIKKVKANNYIKTNRLR
jgi:hypothetical protein